MNAEHPPRTPENPRTAEAGGGHREAPPVDVPQNPEDIARAQEKMDHMHKNAEHSSSESGNGSETSSSHKASHAHPQKKETWWTETAMPQLKRAGVFTAKASGFFALGAGTVATGGAVAGALGVSGGWALAGSALKFVGIPALILGFPSLVAWILQKANEVVTGTKISSGGGGKAASGGGGHH